MPRFRRTWLHMARGYGAWSRSSLATSQGDFPAGEILALGWGYSEYSQYSQYPDYPSLDRYCTQIIYYRIRLDVAAK